MNSPITASASAPLAAPPAGALQQADDAPRIDLLRIAQWIAPGSRVLDLGCADGYLLSYLQRTRQVQGAGVELDDDRVIAAVRRGVRVIQQNLEEGLALFDDQQFDTVVLSQTLQSMHHTEHILHEMARVARYGIVSFPNFGYWPHGWSILRGRMPVNDQMPYQWYDTPNIHLCTLRDFQLLAAQLGLRITHLATFRGETEIHWLRSWRSTLAVYRFESPMGRQG
ncbi:methionine biosynthesis protein MetW [Castellaniella sp.]|uniref:methionine biosynthesis protein MetW n=1 Tax=Castellaniella sp. TaxID=1955812 RepID=UPI002AFFD39B|nr:methionine biosynthesis protein MetW [Castellaniella sp.]